MSTSYLNPTDDILRENQKLRQITEVLMKRVERETDLSSASYSHFHAAIVLESQVRARTKDLADALDLLNTSNAALTTAKAEADQARSDLTNALEAIREGFGLFNADDRLVMRNSRFCAYLPDVADILTPGISFEDYVTIVSDSAYLVRPERQNKEDWRASRMQAHKRRHVNFIVELKLDRWVQVSEQRTPENGTAILQTDVTDMLRLERQERDKLLDSQARLIAATLDHLNQGVAIFDANLRLVGANRRLQELLLPPLQLLRTGTSFPTMRRYFEGNPIFQETTELRRLNDWVLSAEGRHPLALSLTTIDNRHMDVFCQETPDQGVVISFTDITAERSAVMAMHTLNETLESRVAERTAELQAARDVAERASASKSRFVAAVSHDLLQPLNAAKLFLSSLSEMKMGGDQRDLTTRISNAFDSVETILGALLDITKLDADNPTLDRSDFAVNGLLQTLADEFHSEANRKGLTLKVMPSTMTVNSDPAYLRRVLQNLVGNAIRYTSRGRVLVGARRRGDHLRLEVWDTGRGIPAEQHGEIFKEFKRIATDTATGPGMGLGLAIVERACHLLDHPLSFDSCEGRGTVFRVDVPISSRPVAKHRDRPVSDRNALSLESMFALLIENEPEVLAGMSMLLDSWGMHTVEAASGEQAQNIIDDIDVVPDVILADLHLGAGEDGLTTIAKLRHKYGDIPAVLITADRDSAILIRTRENRVVLLQKPVEPHRLRSILSWVHSQGQ